MIESSESREQEIAQALKQLTTDHQGGRLSLSAYRRLRRTLLERVDKGKDLMPLVGAETSGRVRPGIVVWIAVAAIVLLLALLGWLLR